MANTDATPSPQQEEQQFLSTYRLEDYDRPSVTADVAVFALQTQTGSVYRKDPHQSLSLLLIRRGVHPFRDLWALPGGFLRMDETMEDCAFRELTEETGLAPTDLLPIDVFSDPDRDPRGRIVSFAYAAIVGEADTGIRGGDDAAEARWFRVDYTEAPESHCRLTLTSDDITLTATLAQTPSRCGPPRFRLLEGHGLAFDHAQIIAGALGVLRREAERFDIVFDFLPETFTLSALQKVQQTLLGTTLLPANFRRKAAEHVVETDSFTEGAGHRPARLYRRSKQP